MVIASLLLSLVATVTQTSTANRSVVVVCDFPRFSSGAFQGMDTLAFLAPNGLGSGEAGNVEMLDPAGLFRQRHPDLALLLGDGFSLSSAEGDSPRMLLFFTLARPTAESRLNAAIGEFGGPAQRTGLCLHVTGPEAEQAFAAWRTNPERIGR